MTELAEAFECISNSLERFRHGFVDLRSLEAVVRILRHGPWRMVTGTQARCAAMTETDCVRIAKRRFIRAYERLQGGL